MKLEIVTIGDELLLGFTVDTNAAYLARALAAEGIAVVQRTTVGDDAAAIAAAVRAGLERTGAVITTGGLGPTADDLTKPSIASLFGRDLHLDERHAEWMRERWRSRFGREMPDANLQQATVPDGSRLLRNNHGSAPGILLEDERGRWVAMLPGVPREMRGMCDDTIVPFLRDRIQGDGEPPVVIASRTLRTTGIAESLLARRVATVAERFEGVSTAYLPGIDGVDLRLTVRGLKAAHATHHLAVAEAALRRELGSDIYGVDDEDLAQLALAALRNRSLTLAVAESCTGGLLGARVTAVPGSSDVFLGGVIAYANEVKVNLLGVNDMALEQEGAVSEEIACRMASAARERTGASVGVGITGVAGPGGGTDAKPVGTVWLATDLEGRVEAARLMLWGNREEIRHRATQSALDILRRRLAAS